jgi:hypothetical protein
MECLDEMSGLNEGKADADGAGSDVPAMPVQAPCPLGPVRLRKR